MECRWQSREDGGVCGNEGFFRSLGRRSIDGVVVKENNVKAECSPSTKPLFVINQRLLDYLPYENSENIERKEEEEEVEDIRLGRNSGINFGMKLVGSQEEMPEESIFNSLSEDKGVRGFTGGSIVVSTLLGTIIIKILL